MPGDGDQTRAPLYSPPNPKPAFLISLILVVPVLKPDAGLMGIGEGMAPRDMLEQWCWATHLARIRMRNDTMLAVTCIEHFFLSSRSREDVMHSARCELRPLGYSWQGLKPSGSRSCWVGKKMATQFLTNFTTPAGIIPQISGRK
jgi:hypothetical protein